MARVRMRQDSIDYSRQKRLWEKKIGTAVEFELRKKAYELSKQELQTLTNELYRTEVALKSKLQQAENNYRNSVSNADDFVLLSKIEGKVYEIFKEPGEMINPQVPLAKVGSATNFVVEMEVDETDIVRLQPGQQVLVSLDAYSNESTVFEAHITRIFPQKDARTRTFTVHADFKE